MCREVALIRTDTNLKPSRALVGIDNNLPFYRFYRRSFSTLNLKDLNNEELCEIYNQGKKEALDFIISNNKKLIYSRVSKYGNLYNNNLDFDDLVQHGNIGLIKAIERFDKNRNTKFSTYSTWWIDKEILKGIFDSGFLIRIPNHKFEDIQKVGSVIKDMGKVTNEDLTQIALQCGMDKTKVKEAMAIINEQLNIFSLNNIITKDNDTEFLNVIPDDSEKSIDNIIEESELSKELLAALSILSSREKKIMQLRYGLEDDIPRTFEEIGRIFNLSKERIRQIEIKCLKKLRTSEYMKSLKDYVK